MPFLNRIRLPIKISRPQFPEEREVFRKANGVSKTISVVVRKTYILETALMPARIHERLKIALVHDTVNIENDKYLGGVSQSGDYSIEWPEFQDFPVAKATATLEVTPFNASNNNCATCEEMSQIVANDDTIPDPVTESEVIVVNVLANDDVCCAPVVVSIVSTNSAYVASAVVGGNSVTITLKDTVATADGIILATYRATCGNGSYDEADIIADVTGSVAGCTAPQNVRDQLPPFENSHTIEWDDTAPDDGYQWQLFEESNLGSPVQTGTSNTNSAAIVMLNPCTDYRFFVRALCGPDNASAYSQMTFSTACQTQNCGRYEVTYDDGSPDPGGFTQVYYLDCAGQQQVFSISNLQTRYICAIQNAPQQPVQIISNNQGVNYIYVGDC